MSDKHKLELLDHAMWLHNAGVDPTHVLRIAQTLADWCTNTEVVRHDKPMRVVGGYIGEVSSE